jgi:hypothetical protein
VAGDFGNVRGRRTYPRFWGDPEQSQTRMQGWIVIACGIFTG